MPGRELILHPARDQCLTLEALAVAADLHPSLVARFLDDGLLEPVSVGGRGPRFDVSAVPRLRLIRRLRDDLEINLAGIAVVLDLLERLRALRRELAGLRRE